MLLKPILAVIQLILTFFDKYEGGMMDYGRGYTYILLLTNVSQTIALYCLIYIYHAIHHCEEMREKDLLSKFLCIKAVVFFAFWQSCLFSFLEYLDVIKDGDGMDATTRATAMEDFVLCVEMLGFAVLHVRIFTYKPYRAIAEPVAHALKETGWRSAEDSLTDEQLGAIGEALPSKYRNMNEEELEAAAAEERQQREAAAGTKRSAVKDILMPKDILKDVKQHLIPSQDAKTPEDEFLTPAGANPQESLDPSKPLDMADDLQLTVDNGNDAQNNGSYQAPSSPDVTR